MKKELKTDYQDKLKMFLTTPHNAKVYFDLYQKENDGIAFDAYAQKLKDLLSDLDEGKIKSQSELCKQIKVLKLPHNQFGC